MTRLSAVPAITRVVRRSSCDRSLAALTRKLNGVCTNPAGVPQYVQTAGSNALIAAHRQKFKLG